MRALVKAAPGPGMALQDVPVPTCGPTDALIRVHHAGVCGTDLHIWEWDSWASNRLKPPVVIGHEFAGEIVQLGREAATAGLLAVGDLVTAEGHIVCGHCLQCRLGAAHLCQRTQIIGVDRDGAFAEFIAMPASNVMRLDGISTEIGAIMDPMGNAVHTVLEAEVPGSTVLVLGCGPIGCFAVGVARAAGASLVIASDYNPMRLNLARADGRARHAQSGRRRRAGPGARADPWRRRRPGLRDERPSERPRAGLRRGAAGRPGQPAGHAEPDDRGGLRPRRDLQGAHAVRRDRPQDVRDLGRDAALPPAPASSTRGPSSPTAFRSNRIAEAIQVIKDGQAGKVILEIGA